ncbi:hypothetical protein NTG1052_70055 [Candidatus Nitrotoga sp. 1052]|nr:hypothetical protein NTG1052_70055 [Candidatus Nitrotoga sp. 1052]
MFGGLQLTPQTIPPTTFQEPELKTLVVDGTVRSFLLSFIAPIRHRWPA